MIGSLRSWWVRFLGKPGRFAAVDFDARRVRVVLAQPVSAGTQIAGAVSVEIPDEIDVTDPQVFGKFLGRNLKDIGLRGGGVVMNVPRSQAVLKPLSLPPGTSRDEMPGMVQYQVEKELPFPPEDAVIDFTTEKNPDPSETSPETPQDDENHEVNVLVGAIRLGVVDYYRQICESAGVKLLGLGLRPYSNMRCVELSEDSPVPDPVAVVQITADETEIDLIAHNSLVFSRSAVKEITPAGVPDDRTVHSLAAEVARTLQSYQALERGEKLARVLLAGETGLESQVGEAISARLSVPCEIVQSSRAFRDTDRAEISSGFISALGLAVAYATDRQLPFDFVNPKRTPVKRDPRKVRAAAIAGGVAVLLLIAIVARAAIVGAKQDRINALLNREKRLNETIKVARARAQQVDAIEEWIESGHDWLAQWAHLSCLLPSAKDVYLTNFRTGRDGAITFTVRAASSEAINALNRQLGEAGYDFKPGQIKTGADKYGYRYSTTLKLVASSTAKVDLATTRPVPRPKDDSTPEQFVKKSPPPGRSPRKATPRRPRIRAAARRRR